MIADVIKLIVPAVLSFWVGVFITPFLTDFLYKHKLWKKRAGKTDSRGQATQVFNKLHKEKEVGTPRLGGVVIWLSVLITIGGIWLIAHTTGDQVFSQLDFLSRSQTWIPLSTLLLGAGIGLIDDVLEIQGSRRSRATGGLSLPVRLLVVALVGLICGLWFYAKLNVTTIGIPFTDGLYIGWLIVPLFIVVLIALYSGGVIDGIDGLAGGIFASIFAAYAGLAFFQHQIDLAAFCATLLGGILAFLWFNIPPARFYMSETGSMALSITVGVVAFFTDSLAVASDALPNANGGHGLFILPIVAFPLVITVASNLIQVVSKRFRGGQKILRVAPLHHHFEAIGWPSYKVTMRYWVISVVTAMLGLLIGIVG